MNILYRAVYRTHEQEGYNDCFMLAENMEVAVQKLTAYISSTDKPDAVICSVDLVASEDESFGSFLLLDHPIPTQPPVPIPEVPEVPGQGQ